MFFKNVFNIFSSKRKLLIEIKVNNIMLLIPVTGFKRAIFRSWTKNSSPMRAADTFTLLCSCLLNYETVLPYLNYKTPGTCRIDWLKAFGIVLISNRIQNLPCKDRKKLRSYNENNDRQLFNFHLELSLSPFDIVFKPRYVWLTWSRIELGDIKEYYQLISIWLIPQK